jgi:penicillin-binding protein 1C
MKWAARLSVAALLAGALLLRLLPAPPLARYAPSSTAVYALDGELLRLTVASDHQYRLWTPLAQVSPDYVAALLLHEDRHFGWHFGINPLALVRAAWRTGSGGVRQGGSTVTMQLARLVYRLNTKTLTGKLRQIACAEWLELRYSKAQILEAYVNLTPYGRNVQGVGAASLIYFGKPAARLTFAESLALAVIPQAPRARGARGLDAPALSAARVRLADEWARTYPAPPEALAAARGPLQLRTLQQLPFEAPHLVDALLSEGRGTTQTRTTLVLAQQHVLERAVRQYIATTRSLGVSNAAALLVDTRAMSVTALVGSADFFDAAIAGQVNGVAAKRSPGSALKPFIYGLAIDQGIIHTRSILKDAPTAFGGYAPENFDGTFVGPVSAHDALIASRNVPAVWLAAQLAQPDLYQLLQSAGVAHLASEQHYGLALALGGGEVTMEELAGLYAMLANGGKFAPLRYLAATPAAASVPLLSRQAAFMVLSILRDNPRPDGLPNQQPRIAWKTGTSWGFRDAWSAGVVGPYVLIVWVGDFDGSSNPALVGAQVAAPLFFRIADALRASHTQLGELQLRPPPGVARVAVCAASGDLPNDACPQRTLAWYIPGKSPIRISTVHRRIALDTRTGLMACADTPPQFVAWQVFEFWPSDIQKLFARAGMPRRRAPADRCGATTSQAMAAPPVITSPRAGVSYQLRTSQAARETLQLTATAAAETQSLYWFADSAFLGSSAPSVPLAWLPARGGDFTLSVVDDHGASASRVVRVDPQP